MSRKYKIFLSVFFSLLVVYTLSVVVFNGIAPEGSNIRSAIGNHWFSVFEDINLLREVSGGGFCTSSIPGECFGPSYHINPLSWFHLVVVTVMALFSYTIGAVVGGGQK